MRESSTGVFFQDQFEPTSRIQGLEANTEVAVEGWSSRWTPTFSAAWQRGDNQVSQEPLPLIAPFVGQARLRWSPRRTRLWSEIGAILVTDSDRVPAGFTPIRGYTTFTWRGGYEMVRGEHGLGSSLPPGISSVNLYAGLENLGNRMYFGFFETVPQPGRDFRFGLDIALDSSAR